MITAFIASRWLAALARVSPSTSISHGTAHKPWIAMNEPMPNAPIGASHQNRGCTNTVRTPANCVARPPESTGFSMSGTRHQIANATASVATDRPTNTPRQCVNVSAISSGTVVASAPTPPATMIQPEYDACRSAGYHAAIAFSGAIRHAQTPAPISARATASPVSVSANANSAAPAAATASSAGSTRRGP